MVIAENDNRNDVVVTPGDYRSLKKQINSKTKTLERLSKLYLRILEITVQKAIVDEKIANELTNLKEMLNDMPELIKNAGESCSNAIDSFLSVIEEADEDFKL